MVMLLMKGKSRPVSSISPDGKRIKNAKGEWVPRKTGDSPGKQANTSRKSTQVQQLEKGIRDTANEVMSYTKNEFERGVLLDETGSVLFATDGERGQVAFTQSQAKKMKHNTLVHNHPGNSGLSDQDILMAVANGLAGIIAVTEKVIYKYTVDPGLHLKFLADTTDRYIGDFNKLPADFQVQEMFKNIHNNHMNRIQDRIRTELQQKVNDEEITPDEASFTHSRLQVKYFVDKFGGKYEEWNR